MILYIIYFLFTPVLWIFTIVLSLFFSKIRKNYFSFYSLLSIAKKQLLKYNPNNKKILLFHAASSGEYEQLKPLLRLIDKKKYFIIQSFTSPTIYEKEKKSSLYDISCYHPFDLPWLSLYFFLALKPDKYIITRHDLWPGHIIIASRLKIPTYYINANLHKNSIWLKKGIQSLSKYIFSQLTKIIVPSQEIANNFYTLKIKQDIIMISSDSRFDQVQYRKENKKYTKKLFNLFTNRDIILFGSIDPKDEKIIFKSLRNIYPLGTKDLINQNKYLLFIPHEVDIRTIKRLSNELDKLSFKYSKYSESLSFNTNVMLIDSIGLLADLYEYSNKAYVGGGFSRGVHSVLEPAIYNCSIGHGPNIEMLDEAKFLVNNNYAKIIYNEYDMDNFLLSEDVVEKYNLFNQSNAANILNHILR